MNTSSPASQAPPEALQRLIADSAVLNAKIKGLEVVYKETLAALLDAHAQGLVRSKFTAYDTDFNLTPGRASWSYDSDVTDYIKEIQQWAQSNQKATRKTGTPFWTLRAARND